MNTLIANPQVQDRWSHTLEAFIDWVTFHESLGDVVILRRMMDVIRHAPHPGLVAGLGCPDDATVEPMLAAGGVDALALRLIGRNNGFFVSRGAAGDYLVSVLLAGRGDEMTAAGTTLVRAVVCALALSLSQADRRGGPGEHCIEPGYAGYLQSGGTGATLH